MELYFSSDYDQERLFLMQVPEKILSELDKSEDLIIKGKCPSFLCSKNETFKLSGMDTTNTILFLYSKRIIYSILY